MFKKLSAFALAMAASASTFAAGEVTIPETGIDITGYVGAAITSIGAVVAAVVGGYVAFLVVRKGIRWIGRALG